MRVVAIWDVVLAGVHDQMVCLTEFDVVAISRIGIHQIRPTLYRTRSARKFVKKFKQSLCCDSIEEMITINEVAKPFPHQVSVGF
jgi:hypothetical protein